MKRIVLSLFAGVLLWTGAAGAQDVVLLPHRAVYELDLQRVEEQGTVTGASGRLEYVIRETCDAWETNHIHDLALTGHDGATINSRSETVTTEAKDGLSYQFRSETFIDTRPTESIAGDAQLESRDGPGRVEFADGGTLDLPAGTLFPTGHTVAAIEAAQRGERLFFSTMYDGSERDKVYSVSVAIGDRNEAGEDAAYPLLRSFNWPMSAAFFEQGGAQDEGGATEPTFEVSGPMHVNGVSGDMLIQYEGFSVRARLTELEALPRPEC